MWYAQEALPRLGYFSSSLDQEGRKKEGGNFSFGNLKGPKWESIRQ